MPEDSNSGSALIIGAGPAGLTAAYELLARTSLRPVVLEMSEQVGGLCKTVNYRGNRIDIGGHRFFSKSDRVTEWWLRILPLQSSANGSVEISYQNQHGRIAAGPGPDPDREDRVMLIRERRSRVYFNRQLFQYPITLNADTIRKLGFRRTVRVAISYLRTAMFPIKPERTLEDFFINRFGVQLYLMFFKSYTEKVWGLACRDISAEWGAQRIKGLSIRTALAHFISGALRLRRRDVLQKGVETSLIERFMYPKFGPGQMWEEVARQIRAAGGEILTGWRVLRLEHDAHRRLTAVVATHHATGEQRSFAADYFFSTMPVKELIDGLTPDAPPHVKHIADGLVYRDFIVIGLLCDRLALRDTAGHEPVKDNWIYIQDPEVRVGRLQIFNNWSPYLVADRSKFWIGLEYFCFEGDDLWNKSDHDLTDLATAEASRLGIVESSAVRDATVIRMKKTYPAYFGIYDRFEQIVDYVDRFDNLFLIGRNGMHRYNNQDHSMLAAMTAVDNIVNGVRSRDNLWSLNSEQEYHEEK
jgi:protoporphyrinogen oxidase